MAIPCPPPPQAMIPAVIEARMHAWIEEAGIPPTTRTPGFLFFVSTLHARAGKTIAKGRSGQSAWNSADAASRKPNLSH